MTEAELRTRIIGDALGMHIGVRYVPDSRKVVVGAGFPDLTLVGRVVECWELKSETGELTGDELVWAGRLTMAAGVEHRIVRPSDYRCGLVYQWLRMIAPVCDCAGRKPNRKGNDQ